MLDIKKSYNLGVNYVYLPEQEKFLCENGVLITKEEYQRGINLATAYLSRQQAGQLYDWDYCIETGNLRKKVSEPVEKMLKKTDSDEEGDLKDTLTISQENKVVNKELENVNNCVNNSSTDNDNSSTIDIANRPKNKIRSVVQEVPKVPKNKKINLIPLCLIITSLIAGYISTLHTAEYLFDYTDHLSSWLMSLSVTLYNIVAFEVAVVFKKGRRIILAGIFLLLWGLVTLFSMATTVSVFWDRYNFETLEAEKINNEDKSNELQLKLLQDEEKDLRESIAFKKQDIEYRQQKEYSTSAVRKELNELEEKLANNRKAQRELIEVTPVDLSSDVQKVRKESLFVMLARIFKIKGEILEFIMSVLSAVFVNLIAPLSLTASMEIKNENTN